MEKVWLKSVPPHPFDEARTWLIAASAGCGKTHIIKETIKNLIQDKHVPPSHIMVVQFNRKPSDELRRTYIAQGYTKRDLLWFNTFDSIAQRLLRQRRGKINMLVGGALIDWGKKNGFSFQPKEGDKQRITNPVFESLTTKVFAALEGELDKTEKTLLARFEFFALHHRLYPFFLALRDAIQLDLFPADIEYIFVDEGQDNGKIQLDYYQRMLAKHPTIRGLMIVGDDKQTINEFRGGSATQFLAFPADRYVSIPITYRCPQAVLAFANKIIAPVTDRSPVVEQSQRPYPGVVRQEPDFLELIGDIKHRMKTESILILGRTKFSVSPIRQVLTEYFIPIKAPLEENVHEVLKAFARIKATGLITYDDHMAILPFDEKGRAGRLRKTAYWKLGQFAKAADTTRDYTSLDESLDPIYPCPVEDASKLGLIKSFKNDVERGWPNPKLFSGDQERIKLVIDYAALHGAGYTPVDVSTIHGAKGMEADIVVLIRNITQRVDQSETYDRDSERRVWYVAATRARKELWVTIHAQSLADIFTRIL